MALGALSRFPRALYRSFQSGRSAGCLSDNCAYRAARPSLPGVFWRNLPILVTLAMLSASAHTSCVILLHGLARTANSMTVLEDGLVGAGYKTVNLGYPSRQHSIEVLADKAIKPALEVCGSATPISFVTHSLGGILVRQYTATRKIPNLRYVVMLGPPNQGSEVVDKLQSMPGFYMLNGDAGTQLGTAPSSVPMRLGKANFNLGIIAGNRSVNWILSLLIPGDDDGKVGVQRTKLEGMNDHIVLAVNPPLMMQNQEVISQVLYYLKNGLFEQPPNHESPIDSAAAPAAH